MTYTLKKVNFFCEPLTVFKATAIFYYDFFAYSHHGDKKHREKTAKLAKFIA